MLMSCLLKVPGSAHSFIQFMGDYISGILGRYFLFGGFKEISNFTIPTYLYVFFFSSYGSISD